MTIIAHEKNKMMWKVHILLISVQVIILLLHKDDHINNIVRI